MRGTSLSPRALANRVGMEQGARGPARPSEPTDRTDGQVTIRLNRTTFWVSPDKDPRGAMTIEYADGEELGSLITQDALTQACQTDGDLSIVIGFAPNKEQAKKALREHKAQGGGESVLLDHLRDGDAVPSARAARSARRSARRSAKRSR